MRKTQNINNTCNLLLMGNLDLLLRLSELLLFTARPHYDLGAGVRTLLAVEGRF